MKNQISGRTSYKIKFSYNLAAVLIMIMHCSGNLPSRDNWSYELCLIVASAGAIGVSYYLFMSSYFLFRNYDGDYIKLIKKKLKTLFVPYIVWNIIGYFFRLLVRNPLNGLEEEFSYKELLKGFIPFQNANGSLWFIALLIMYVLLTPIFYELIKWNEIVYFIGVTLALNVVINVSSANYGAILFYLPVYFLGGYVALHYSEKFEHFIAQDLDFKYKRSICSICVGIMCICVVIAYYRNLISKNMYCYTAPLLFIMLMKIKKYKNDNNWIAKNGSFIVYVSHGLFTNILGPNIYIYRTWNISMIGDWNNIIPAYVTVIVLCMIFVGIVLLIFWLLRDCKWIWIFTGGRN